MDVSQAQQEEKHSEGFALLPQPCFEYVAMHCFDAPYILLLVCGCSRKRVSSDFAARERFVAPRHRGCSMLWQDFLKQTTSTKESNKPSGTSTPPPGKNAPPPPPKPKEEPAAPKPVESQPKVMPEKEKNKIPPPNVPVNPSSPSVTAAASQPASATPLSWMDFISSTQGAKVEGKEGMC